MNKYRYVSFEEDFAGTGLGWDGDQPTYHEEWHLSNKPHKRDKAELLENYVAPTEKQIDFLKKYADKKDDFIFTRTRKEAAKIIGEIVKGWESDRRYRDNDPNIDEDEYLDRFGAVDYDHMGG